MTADVDATKKKKPLLYTLPLADDGSPDNAKTVSPQFMHHRCPSCISQLNLSCLYRKEHMTMLLTCLIPT